MGVIKRDIGERDVEKTQLFLKDVMSEIKDGPIPLVVVDEMHAIGLSSMAEDAAFQRFLNWCIFLTDHDIANVAFVSRDNVVLKLDATTPTFRQRRVHFPIDLPEAASVREELVRERDLDPGISSSSTSTSASASASASSSSASSSSASASSALPMSEADADYVVETFGGQLKDIETLLNRVECTSARWQHDERVVKAGTKLVRDSVTFIDGVLRELLELATDREGCKRVVRFWDMMKLLVAKEEEVGEERRRLGSVSRGELAAEVFKRRAFEIDRYVDLGVITHVYDDLSQVG